MNAKVGQVVWVRDPSHHSYMMWCAAYFVRTEQHRHAPYLVEYARPGMGRQPGGICGYFPQMRLDAPPKTEQERRVWA